MERRCRQDGLVVDADVPVGAAAVRPIDRRAAQLDEVEDAERPGELYVVLGGLLRGRVAVRGRAGLLGSTVSSMFQSQCSTDTARAFAYTALSMLPALSIFVFAQRYLVGGLVGAIRG